MSRGEHAEWAIIAASDVTERDGFAVELERADGTRVLELFQSDRTGAVTFTVVEAAVVPGEVFNSFLDRARAARIL